MKKQLLHEHHNRQDKVKQPDYQTVMREKGRPDPTITPSSRLVARVSARETLVEEIRKHRFVYRNLGFKFGWNLDVFARKNNLAVDDEGTKAAMETVKQAATRDVEAFAVKIKAAPMNKRGPFYYFDYEKPQTECQMFRQ